MSLSAIVLCGGGSTRMGTDKARLPVGADVMLARVVRAVGAVSDDVVVVARRDQALPPLPAGVAARVAHDAADGLGPLAGLLAGLTAARHDLAFVAGCDMPLIVPALVRRLRDLIGTHDACVPTWEGHVMTLCAVYRRSVAGEAERLLADGRRSVRGLVERIDARLIDAADLRDVDPDLESFFSCDTPERYQALLRRMEGGRD